MEFKGTTYPDVTLPSNRERMTAWVEALESGEYKQAQHQLKDSLIVPGEVGYCCLGVACDIAAKAGLGSWGDPGKLLDPDGPEAGPHQLPDTFYAPDEYGNSGVMPASVAEWFGLDNKNTDTVQLTGHTDEGDIQTGASMNDGGASFAEIAAQIRKTYLS